MALTTVPSLLLYWVSSQSAATVLLWIFVPAVYFYIGPILGLLQNVVPANMRATACALLLFLANLGNLVIAPQVIGWLSDWFRASFGAGTESLRWALLLLAPTGAVGGVAPVAQRRHDPRGPGARELGTARACRLRRDESRSRRPADLWGAVRPRLAAMAFPESLFSYRPLHGAPARPVPAFDPELEAEAPERADDGSPWSVIWSVGGACWLIVTCTALLWMMPASGTHPVGCTWSPIPRAPCNTWSCFLRRPPRTVSRSRSAGRRRRGRAHASRSSIRCWRCASSRWHPPALYRRRLH